MSVPGKIPCPFVYAGGKRCEGHITRIERYKTSVSWEYDLDRDTWSMGAFDEGTHLHLYCSEKGDHSGPVRRTDERMKAWPSELGAELYAVVFGAYHLQEEEA